MTAASEVNNLIPDRMARVLDMPFADAPTLGAPHTNEVFVTAQKDIAEIYSASELTRRLTLLNTDESYRSGPFAVIEFDTPSAHVASPIRRSLPGFSGKGRTAGDAREFTIPNRQRSALDNVSTRIVS